MEWMLRTNLIMYYIILLRAARRSAPNGLVPVRSHSTHCSERNWYIVSKGQKLKVSMPLYCLQLLSYLFCLSASGLSR